MFRIIWTLLLVPVLALAQGTRNDTAYYFWYNSYVVSAKITPWLNGHRNVHLFDPSGNRIMILSDHVNQDTCITELEFNENGSVKIAFTRYHHHSESWHSIAQTEFTTENRPVRRFIRYYPEGSGHMNESYIWDTELDRWVPEVMELIGPPPKEGPVPDPSENELPTLQPRNKRKQKKNM